MTFRLANKDDIKQIREIYSILFEEMSELQPTFYKKAEQSERFILEVITSEKSDILVAEEKNLVKGFVLVIEQQTPPYPCIRPYNYAQIIDMAVLLKYRSEGIGTQLIEQVKLWSEERFLDFIELDVLEENSKAIKMYGGNGFETAARTMRYML